MNGTDLLMQFRESRSDAAFSELVRRYTNLVYSAAWRRLSNDSLAQEATQIVFIRLARTAPKLRGDAELAAWLHRTTLHVSIDLWRSETRRTAREEKAAAMQPDVQESVLWNEITPVLDEALNKLSDADRQTLLLRFFQQKSMSDLGTALGVSEDAAKMRVSRALDRLRHQLTARRVACSAIVLGGLLAERSVLAAPAKLGAALATIAWPAPATGLAGFLLHVSKIKLAASATGLTLAGVLTFVLLQSQNPAGTTSNSALQQNAASKSNDPSPPAAQDLAAADGEKQPDPLKLLQAVARARSRIASGSVDLELYADHFESGRKETNYLRLKAVFDGQKKWFDSVGREFRYTSIGSEGAAADEAKIQEQNLDREGAVRAGLLEGFEAHYVTMDDGTTLLEYRQTDGRTGDATISGPDGGIATYLFDPRCLGLGAFLYRTATVEGCLGYADAVAVQMAGLESVEGMAAWHVNVVTRAGQSLDFWIDAAHPARVLKYTNGRDVAISKYDDASPDNPLPVEVKTTEYRNGSPRNSNRWIVSRAQFNETIEPARWTLAGLGMAAGTPVVDVRISRQIGFWAGTGLSENLPRKDAKSAAAPDAAAQMAILEGDPSSSNALAAATWILLNSPDGADVEKAADVVIQYHLHNPDLVNLAQEMNRMRHRCSRRLLEAMLQQNPNADVRATACFTLATLLKDQAEYGKNQDATRDADKYFARVISEFSGSGKKGAELARRSKPELYELRNLFIGKPAPDLEGVDLDGKRIRLSDYRGKVVVLCFWTASTASDIAEQNKFIDPITSRRFAAIGIYCDNDVAKAKAVFEQNKITWPSIGDGDQGPISDAWNVHSWLSTFVLDAKGVIRYRNLRFRQLTDAVETLLHE